MAPAKKSLSSKKLAVHFEDASAQKKVKSLESATKTTVTTTTKSGGDSITALLTEKSLQHDTRKGGSMLKKGSMAAPSVYKATGSAVDLVQAQTVRREHEKVMKEERQQRCYLCAVIVICIIVSIVLMGVVLYDRYRPKADYDGQKFGSVPRVGGVTGVNGTEGEEAPEYTDPGTNASRPRKITLKNLTEACMKLKPQGCFYHKNYYPDNCKRTKCDSVIIDLTVKNGIFSWKYADERQEIDVEEYTPCGRGKLCSKGQCVEHSATFDYQLPDPQAGGIGLICQLNTSCLKMGGKLIVGDLAKKYTTCENRNCKKPDYVSQVIKSDSHDGPLKTVCVKVLHTQ
uniref:Uncharacterized protein n=2 Tax=Romanomermis culicivorax TaxID=13658 RepID=A0A915JPI7_ROMCU